MTRWARAFKKTHIDASSWDELKGTSNGDAKSKTKGNLLLKKEKIYKSRKQLEKTETKKERNREARRKRRNRKKICFNCRKSGHSVADCPLSNEADSGTGICFKCGSTEHSIKDCKANVPKDVFPFAKCFICGLDGHISRNCPDNPRGLYPLGGGCAFCDSVEHFKRDCPENPANRKKDGKSRGLKKRKNHDMSSADAENFTDEESEKIEGQKPKRKSKIVKF